MIRRPPRSTRTDTTLSLHDALPISFPIPFTDLASIHISGNAERGATPAWNVAVVEFDGIDLEGATGKGDSADSAQHFRSEEHTSELQSLMRISYAVFCLKKKNQSQTSS